MKIYAIGDLHLSHSVEKPMDIFGAGWDNHDMRIQEDWESRVTSQDLVLVPGDISWGKYMEEAMPDLEWVSKLPGKKIIIRGNHDYWWKTILKVRTCLENYGQDFYALQNDSIRFDAGVVVCGTRGWAVPEWNFKDAEDEKIFKRELIRLELALSDAAKNRKAGDILITMLHYPPFNARLQPSDYTRLCEKYDVNYVVYGHLHGANCRSQKVLVQNGITYLLTSCDKVDCKLVEVCELK